MGNGFDEMPSIRELFSTAIAHRGSAHGQLLTDRYEYSVILSEAKDLMPYPRARRRQVP
jgi:hypothetical protein